MITCKQCGKEFEATGTRGPSPEYCSPKCRQAKWRMEHDEIGPQRAIDSLLKRAIGMAAKNDYDGVIKLYDDVYALAREIDNLSIKVQLGHYQRSQPS